MDENILKKFDNKEEKIFVQKEKFNHSLPKGIKIILEPKTEYQGEKDD